MTSIFYPDAAEWQASYEPYGGITLQLDNVSQKHAFPGQYTDDETGLSYNLFRDYDPEIGRYISSDPIGLDDGPNTYAYVKGNPVNYYDPDGLTSVSSCAMPQNIPACAAAGIINGAFIGGATGGAVSVGLQAYNDGWSCIDWDQVAGSVVDGAVFGAFLGLGEAYILGRFALATPVLFGRLTIGAVAGNQSSSNAYKTWNQFQAGTKGQFANRSEAGQAWAAYKEANSIVNGTARSSAAKSRFLKDSAISGKSPKWMNQWLRQGKVPPGHHVDHIKPLSVGGKDAPSNMRLMDIETHISIHHKLYRPWE